MNKKDKDWTFVNEDGSVQIERDQVLYASILTQKKDSDSEQDFEVVPSWQLNRNDGLKTEHYKGIFIKEDHFAEEDGSDIEVVKCIAKNQAASSNQSTLDKTEEYENYSSGRSGNDDSSTAEGIEGSFITLTKSFHDESSTDSGNEKHILGDFETISDPEEIVQIGNNGFDDDADQFNAENEFDGLADLFKEFIDEKTPSESNKLLLPEEHKNAKEIGHVITVEEIGENGIILSTSVFIILLCLSVTLGLFLGKGLNSLQIPKQPDSPGNENSHDQIEEVILRARSTESHPQVIVFVDKDIYKLNYTTIWASKNAKKQSYDIRVAYQEMQLKYHNLQRKYQILDQEYRVQKHLMLLSRKKTKTMSNISIEKTTNIKDKYPKLNLTKGNATAPRYQNQEDIFRELTWWKMRTVLWRQKYLNLRVNFLNKGKNWSQANQPNVTFNNCMGVLAKYIPDLNVTSLLKQDTRHRITTSARNCWRKVFAPVQEVSSRMTSGIFKFSQNAWGTFSRSWNKEKHEKKNGVDKSFSKWQRFRKVFSISNIVGSASWKHDRKEGRKTACVNVPGRDEMFCRKKQSRNENNFKDRWIHDAKQAQKVDYLRPGAAKFHKTPNANSIDNKKNNNKLNRHIREDGFDCTKNNCALHFGDIVKMKMMCPNEYFKIEKFPRCKRWEKRRYPIPRNNLGHGQNNLHDHFQKLDEAESVDWNQNNEGIALLEANEMRKEEFENSKEMIRDEMKKKRETFEYHLRKNSNKKREESKLLRNHIKKLENIIKKIQKKFQKLARKLNEIKSKKRGLKKKLKKYSSEHEKRQKKIKLAQKQLKMKSEKLRQKLEHEKQAFEKWQEHQQYKLKKDMESKFKKQHEDLMKSKKLEQEAAKELKQQLKFEQSQLKMEKEKLKNKVFELKRILHKLLEDESEKFNQLRKKSEELKNKQKQMELLKIFYDFEIRNHKDKNKKAKEIAWQTKQKIIRLKSLYKEILNKYKIVHERLNNQREKLKDAERVVEMTYYPTVFCPNKKNCQDDDAHPTDENKIPIVYCPRKDFCTGINKISKNEKKNDIQAGENKEKAWMKIEKQNVKSEKLRLVKPATHMMLKINPFFPLKPSRNDTRGNQYMKVKSQKRPMKPKLKGLNGKWYMNEDDAKQRDAPLTWYFYWGEGRRQWRTSNEKHEDNWYLKMMKERERQRELPVHWYFKRGKQREEYRLDDKQDWIFKRAKSREAARKQEGFYYCW